MGAHTFQIVQGGKGLTPNAAYKNLVDTALFENGHDAYNGTISTTSGYVLVDLPKGRKLQKLIDDICERRHPAYRHIEKWGPAGCIELKGAALTKWRKAHALNGTRARAFVFFGWAAS
jgi:hypothetical protein